MVRRTKEEAEVTRQLILDTAELVFEQRGVAGTSLEAIARAAGLTRGAIYWHFQNKGDLFNAMMERAATPLEQAGAVCGAAGKTADLTVRQMRDGLVEILRQVMADPQMKRVFGISTNMEYVGDTEAIRARQMGARDDVLTGVERTFRRAVQQGVLSRRASPRVAALGLHAMVDGLLRNWTLDPDGFNLAKVGAQVIDAYLDGLAVSAATDRPV